MLSYQVTDFGKPLARVAVETPRPKGTEVLVRVKACGVCHSDLHLADGYYDLGRGKQMTLSDRGIKLPLTLGHEVVGTVAALGPEARGVEPGAVRLVYPWLGCGACAPCRAEEENLCVAGQSIGVFRPGGYSDHLIVPHPKYLVDIDGIDPALAATYACSGVTAFSALKKIGPTLPGDWVAILGLGGVGLAAVHIAPALLGAPVIGIDLEEAKLAAARAAGIRQTVNAGESDAAKRLRGLAGNRLMAVVDFVGSAASAKLALDALTKGGRYIVVGLFGGEITLPLVSLPLKALTLRGSYVGSLPELKELIGLVKAGKIKPIPVASRPLEDANAALADLRAGRIIGRQVLAP
ncbi:MAG: alcohol dehydrogenase catalytic domain-containing protein [Proteobacteria bacterium]|nr:alcohol dehydrogenase catalytic domain-containing protein [Pseudomonadota bacterium]MBI3498930.1 alcohol dehydrogenase catalytic domain-containing protein [Pseudomonadota bacterium]